MPIIEYNPALSDLLLNTAKTLPQKCALLSRRFVDYYYTNNDWCRLFLFMPDDKTITGIAGVERMRFEFQGREFMVAFGSNFYSLQPGVGGLVFARWMKECPVSMVFGGSPDTHRILEKQKWTYYSGVRMLYLNKNWLPSDEDGFQRRTMKKALNIIEAFRQTGVPALEKKIQYSLKRGISIREEKSFAEDLPPSQSPFLFRFAPSLEYLRWRYNLHLDFIRYRLFRIIVEGKSSGYVIINDAPQQIIVSHGDAADADSLAYGMMLSLVEVARNDKKPRQMMLTTSHPAMRAVFESFGFRPAHHERPLAMGSLLNKVPLPPADTSNWLVNFDWGDNGLRLPLFYNS